MTQMESRLSAEFIAFRDEIVRILDAELELNMNRRALVRKQLFVSQAKALLAEEVVKASGLSRSVLSDLLKPLGNEVAEIRPSEEEAVLPFVAAFSRKIVPIEKMLGLMGWECRIDCSLILDHPLNEPPDKEAYLAFGVDSRTYSRISINECIYRQRMEKKLGLTVEAGITLAFLFPAMVPDFGIYLTGSRYARADAIPCIWKFRGRPILDFVESEEKLEHAVVFSCNRYSSK